MSRRNIVRIVCAIVPVITFLAVYSVYWPPDVPLFSPDSHSYLEFAGIRSGGYPFFLAVLRLIFPDEPYYVIGQFTLYGLSVLIFAWQLYKSEDNLLFCLIVELGLLANWEVNRYHFTIATETLFLSIGLWFLAAALSHLRTGSLASIAVASGAAAAALTVRLTGLAFVAAVPILLLAGARTGSLVARIGFVILPIVAVIGAENLYYHAYHPGPRESQLYSQLTGKAGMISVAHPEQVISQSTPVEKPMQEAMEYQLAPVRALVAGVPNLATRCRLELWYEIFVEFEFAPNARGAIEAAEGRDGLTHMALARLRAGIPDYLRLTKDHLFCLWTVWATEESEKAALASYLDAHSPVPFAESVLPSFEKSRTPPFPRVVRWTLLTIGAVLAVASALFLVGLAVRRPLSLAFKLSGICGIIVHAGLILSALGSVGIPRYTIGLWPPLEVGVLFLIASMLRCTSRSAMLMRRDTAGNENRDPSPASSSCPAAKAF